jgi:hypothetical protein
VAKSFTDLSHLTAGLKAEAPVAPTRTGRAGRLQASRDFH